MNDCQVCGWTQKHPEHPIKTWFWVSSRDAGKCLWLLKCIKWTLSIFQWTYYVTGSANGQKIEKGPYVYRLP